MTMRFSNQLVAELYQPFWAGKASAVRAGMHRGLSREVERMP
jgi:hypothetical protein